MILLELQGMNLLSRMLSICSRRRIPHKLKYSTLVLIQFISVSTAFTHRRGRLVKDARLRAEIRRKVMRLRPGFATRRLEKLSVNPAVKRYFFRTNKDKTAKKRDGFRLSSAVPKIQ